MSPRHRAHDQRAPRPRPGRTAGPSRRAARLLALALLTVAAGCNVAPPGRPSATVVRTPSAASTTAPPTTPANPFAGEALFVDPGSDAARDAAALATAEPAAAAALRKLASQPQADWFGDWNATSHLSAEVARRVDQITGAGAYPVLVAYNVPKRDCDGYSGGGAPSASAYRAWIRALKAGIGDRPATVILEPDALAQVSCLSPADRTERIALLRDATRVLAAGGDVAVYLDAGNAGWVAPDVMAQRLRDAGIEHARGFSLNVSNFGRTEDQVAYGRRISAAAAGKPFVVDTSRNGLGPATGLAEAWCNPPGRALGTPPTTATGDDQVDAFLWVKRPGESDGTCNGGPTAGTWWRAYAVGLAERATW